MNNLKKIIVLGSGNSGAGGIHDYLLSRDDIISPFNGSEFRLINDPDGLDDLYTSLYEKFSINQSALSILRFQKFIKRLVDSKFNKKNYVYSNELVKISDDFLNKIIEISYNGSPQFYFDKMSKNQKYIFYFKRFVLRKQSRSIDLLKMSLPVNKNEFFKNCENYLQKIFSTNCNLSTTKGIVINQGGNFWYPLSSTKYYGKNTYPILVTRDPKGIFWSMKRRKSLSYPGHDIKIFVRWYRSIMEKIDLNEFKKIIHIRYENFFSNYRSEKIKLCDKLGIPAETNDKFNLANTKKNLFKFKDNLQYAEIEFIDKELKEFIQC